MIVCYGIQIWLITGLSGFFGIYEVLKWFTMKDMVVKKKPSPKIILHKVWIHRGSLQETPAFDNMTFVANPTLRTANSFTSFIIFHGFSLDFWSVWDSLITSDFQNDNFLADIKEP